MKIEEVGPFVRSYRWQNRKTVKKLALKIGMHASHLSAIELGSRIPNIHCLRNLARGLDCELDIQFKPKEK